MSKLSENYEFTINDFEKNIHIVDDAGTLIVKLNSVKQNNNNIYFTGQYSLLDDTAWEWLEEEFPEFQDNMQKLAKEKIKQVCIISNFSFYIPVNALIQAFKRDDYLNEHTVLNNDALDIKHELIDIFFSNDFETNNTEKAIDITNKEFINIFLKEFENLWKYLIEVENNNNSTLLSFECPYFYGLKFSSECYNKFS